MKLKTLVKLAKKALEGGNLADYEKAFLEDFVKNQPTSKRVLDKVKHLVSKD